MNVFFENLGQHQNVLQTFIIGCFFLIGLIFLIIIGRMKLWDNFSLTKEGFIVNSKKKEEQLKFESGNLTYLLNNHITECDRELLDFAIELSNEIRLTLAIELNEKIKCTGIRVSLISFLRYPLWDSARKNHFKDTLKPENIKLYIDKILKKMINEYKEYSIGREAAWCSEQACIKCPNLPPFSDVVEILRKEITENWASPIRSKCIEICEKKIKFYQDFLPSFQELQDNVKIKIMQECIDKNKKYITALKRTPEAGEF